jgi:hypothetical protein
VFVTLDTARQRKAEAEKLNEQLRKINASLPQQTRAGAVCLHDVVPFGVFLQLHLHLVTSHVSDDWHAIHETHSQNGVLEH